MAPKRLPAFLLVAALPVSAALLHTETLDEFGRTAAQAVDDVARFNETLSLNWSVPTPGRKPPPKPEFAGMKCERAQQFSIITKMTPQQEAWSEAGQLALGICKAEAGKVRDFAVEAQKQGKTTLDKFLAAAKPEDRAKLEKLVSNETVSLPGGATGYAFTMVLVGHGIMFMHGAVLHDPARQTSYIVLADVYGLCPQSPDDKDFFHSTLCPDTGKALLDVVTNLAKRDGRTR
jgi:hypothetical protein